MFIPSVFKLVLTIFASNVLSISILGEYLEKYIYFSILRCNRVTVVTVVTGAYEFLELTFRGNL